MSASKDKKKKPQIPAQFKTEKLDAVIPPGHGLPCSRRELLAYGFTSMAAGAIAVPHIVDLFGISNQAWASGNNCNVQIQFPTAVPFLQINLAGGGNIAGQNILVGDGGILDGANYQEDFMSGATDYLRLGIPAELHPNRPGMVNGTYGLKFHSASGILAGMNEVLENGTLMINGRPVSDQVDGAILCNASSDDTSSNTQCVNYWVTKLTAAQGALPGVDIVGTATSPNGARSQSHGFDAGRKATQVASYNQASGLAGLNLPSLDENQQSAQRFLNRVAQLSRTRLDKLRQISDPAQAVASVLDCKYQSAAQVLQHFRAESLRPNPNSPFAQIYNGEDEREAAGLYLLLEGYAGAATLNLGGYDYHGNPVAMTHGRDQRLGRVLGRAIVAALTEQKPLFIHLFTDGGVGGDNAGQTSAVEVPGLGEVALVNWSSDSGQRSSSCIFMVKPGHDGSPMFINGSNGTPTRQLGLFNKGGGVNPNTVINSPVNTGMAVVANWLQAMGLRSRAEEIFGSARALEAVEKYIVAKEGILGTVNRNT